MARVKYKRNAILLSLMCLPILISIIFWRMFSYNYSRNLKFQLADPSIFQLPLIQENKLIRFFSTYFLEFYFPFSLSILLILVKIKLHNLRNYFEKVKFKINSSKILFCFVLCAFINYFSAEVMNFLIPKASPVFMFYCNSDFIYNNDINENEISKKFSASKKDFEIKFSESFCKIEENRDSSYLKEFSESKKGLISSEIVFVFGILIIFFFIYFKFEYYLIYLNKGFIQSNENIDLKSTSNKDSIEGMKKEKIEKQIKKTFERDFYFEKPYLFKYSMFYLVFMMAVIIVFERVGKYKISVESAILSFLLSLVISVSFIKSFKSKNIFGFFSNESVNI